MFIKKEENSCCQRKHASNSVEKNSSALEKINESTIDAVEFCSNIISRNGLGIWLEVDRFESYRDIASTEIKCLIKSRKALKKLLCSFPLVFNVVDNQVTLRSWIIFHLNQQEWLQKLLPSSFHSVPIYISAIQFYCNELFKKAPIFELPLHQLYSLKKKAPTAIKDVTKNTEEFQLFLQMYPDIFQLNGDKVILSKSALSYRSLGVWIKRLLACDFNTEGESSTVFNYEVLQNEVAVYEALGFHYSLLFTSDSTKGISLEKLLCEYNRLVPNSTFLKNIPDLESFIAGYPEVFKLINKTVYLAQFHSNYMLSECASVKENHSNCSKVCILNDPSTLNAAENAISFYSNVLRNQKNRIISLINISGHRGIAPADVKTVAKNPKELKIFFSQFPEVFTLVGDDKVMLSKPYKKMASLQQQKETFGIFFNHSEQDAVEYFSKMLNLNGICRVLNIKELFELKLKSSPAIHKTSGSNIKQFLAFLKKYPQEFIVTNENVIAKKKISRWSYNGKYENKKLTDKLLLLILNFFKAIMKSLFHIDHLYNNIGRCFLYNDKTPVFPSKTDLLLFLGLYPRIFFVDNCRIVNIIASGKKAYVYSINNKKNNQNIPLFRKLIIPQPIAPNLKQIQNPSSTIIPLSKKMKIDVSNSNGSKLNDLNKMFPLYSNTEFESKKTDLTPRNLPCNQDLEDCLGDNQCTSIQGKNYKEEFTPLSIEEIEKNILSHFIGEVNKNCYFSQSSEEHTLSQTGKVLNNNFLNNFNGKNDFNDPVAEALMFLNGKLWGEGNLKILNIEELYCSFSQSGLGMAKNCCKTIEDFKNFLYKFQDHFIVSREKVMARRNEIQEVSYVLNHEEESITIMLFNFFNLYTHHYNFILLKQLFSQIGKYFCNLNRSPFFKSPSDLVLFLEMFPDVFRIDNIHIENITAPKRTIDCRVGYKRSEIRIDSFLNHTSSVKHSIVPESTDGWKDSVLQNTLVIENISQCKVLTAEILNSHKVIALDCEGVNLGAAGQLTLVQIALENGKIYIFDIFKEKSMVNYGGLKSILESESILKVIHDSRNDVANLYTEYGVKIAPIFDTCVVHHLIVSKGPNYKKNFNRVTLIGFNELCSIYGANLNIQKDITKNFYKSNPSYWMSRPLTKNMIAYAAMDVASLVPHVFSTMLKQLNGIPEYILWQSIGKHSLSFLNDKDLLFD